jgi:hypothetical protein
MKYTIGEITISTRARSETSPQSRLKISDESRLAINLPRATGWPPRLPAPQTLARTGHSLTRAALAFGANGPSAPLRHLRRPPTPSRPPRSRRSISLLTHDRHASPCGHTTPSPKSRPVTIDSFTVPRFTPGKLSRSKDLLWCYGTMPNAAYDVA